MANKKSDSDFDFLGGLGTLTIEEEAALSAFIKKRKIANKPSRVTRTHPVKRPKTRNESNKSSHVN